LRACDKTARQQNGHELSSHHRPLSNDFASWLWLRVPVEDSRNSEPRRAAFGPRQPITASITGARTAGRTPTYRAAGSAEAGPDCGTSTRVARNCPDKGATRRAPCRALEGPGRYRLTRWARTRRRVILRIGNHRDIDECQSRGAQQKDAESSWHSGYPRLRENRLDREDRSYGARFGATMISQRRQSPFEVSGVGLRVPR